MTSIYVQLADSQVYLRPLYDQYIMINNLLPALRARRGGARYAAVPHLRARD